ncbi:MAG: hydantoinase/oxoprolinase family protein [Gammaproteobacteria bacterium]|nr:hydantoinase/oxoprolinase family protein [Gammaproteobacteria bacterium]MYF01437.1 hydantoinase/oxoprolinase family protein [Gammaproteobacteria bacterium]MYI77146.1 hydantoinase/oxoprolinase family protein [Gammaproteobacteria bacterium]
MNGKNALAVDIGGTFTDVVLQLDQTLHATKVLTTRDDPSKAVIAGIQQLFTESGASPEHISLVLHGTTLATNAIIERRGAKTALLTTAGHRDILEMAFENRFEQYDVNIERPTPLVPRKLRIPIKERVIANGDVLVPLDEFSVQQAIDLLLEEEIESVAIGFLHAYRNGDHETRVAELVRNRMNSIPLSLSSDVCPEIREYERLSTACANAYVLPLMSKYLLSLQEKLNALNFRCPYLMMTSGGGLTSLETAAKYPIRLVESGPAGGAILAGVIARELELDQVLSFDMGGTTAKLCLLDQGKTILSRAFEVDRTYRFKKGSGLPVRIPVIEMVEIGAGGGSIAQVDKLGRIQIGPESAGSTPGPACYGSGGTEPTVTDADCVLGRLDPSNFAGGQLPLDTPAATQAISTKVGAPLALSLEDTALGISEIVDENMTAAAQSHATEWGKSVHDRTLIAFGGAAPLHAARMLEKMNLARVIIPEGAGVGSAIGFIFAPISYEVVRSRHLLLSDFDENLVSEIIKDMRKEANSVVASALYGSEDVTETATAFMRYVGQGHEVTVTFGSESTNRQRLQQNFEETYTALYGKVIPDTEIEVMSWTLNVSTTAQELESVEDDEDNTAVRDQSHTKQELVDIHGVHEATVVSRESLSPNTTVEGPALITEKHTTTVVPPGYRISKLTPSNHLSLERLPI